MRKKKGKKKILNSEAEVFKRSELLEKYMVKILFGQNDREFEDKYLKKLGKTERERETSFFKDRTLKKEYLLQLQDLRMGQVKEPCIELI